MRAVGILLLCLIGACTTKRALPLPPVVVGTPSGPFQGGPLEGLSLGDVKGPAGNHFKGLLPSRSGSSPVVGAQAQAVQAFVRFHDDGVNSDLKQYLADGAVTIQCSRQDRPCGSRPFDKVVFGEPVTANTPFLMADGTIRVEWLYGSALYYISLLKMRGDKIESVETSPAWAPLMVKSPPSSGGHG